MKARKVNAKIFMLCSSICVAFLKVQNYGNEEQTRAVYYNVCTVSVPLGSQGKLIVFTQELEIRLGKVPRTPQTVYSSPKCTHMGICFFKKKSLRSAQ